MEDSVELSDKLIADVTELVACSSCSGAVRTVKTEGLESRTCSHESQKLKLNRAMSRSAKAIPTHEG